MMWQHHAALALGKLTRVTSGVNLPPSEVIMSRRQRREEKKPGARRIYKGQGVQCFFGDEDARYRQGTGVRQPMSVPYSVKRA
jgi:hypothetical protein